MSDTHKMEFVIHRRVEVAIRSLDSRERNRVIRALRELQSTEIAELMSRGKIVKLAGSAKGLFCYKATKNLRVIFGRVGKQYRIVDVVNHDRLLGLIDRRRES